MKDYGVRLVRSSVRVLLFSVLILVLHSCDYGSSSTSTDNTLTVNFYAEAGETLLAVRSNISGNSVTPSGRPLLPSPVGKTGNGS